MIEHLDHYTGRERTRREYTAYRTAKRELYAIRPDIAPQLTAFAMSQTHWGEESDSTTLDDHFDEINDSDFWEELAEEYEGYDNEQFAAFEKFS
jgi:hypothetical protein